MKNKKAHIGFIFATMLIDSLGIGILIPIFPDLMHRFATDPSAASLYFGYFISAYALMQFAASPILGSLSDRYGRRPILLVSLLGGGLDYLIMAFAPNLAILFLGRMISGLTGASMTVASSYMADISDDKNRSANFGMIGAAFGLGFIIGPSLGGLLGSVDVHYPFFAAAALSLINFAFGLFILPESLPAEKRRTNIDLKKLNPLGSIAKILRPSPILTLIWTYILLYLAGQVHPSTWTLYTKYKFGWSAFEVGVSISCVGLAIALVQGGLTRIVIPKWGEWRTVNIGTWVNALGFLGFAMATKSWMLYAILVPSALSGVAGPALQSLISKNTPANEQGELQGTLVSLASLTAIAGPLLYTSLFAYFTRTGGIYLPGSSYYAAALICFISLVLLKAASSPEIKKQSTEDIQQAAP